jgi:hypothetical protein
MKISHQSRPLFMRHRICIANKIRNREPALQIKIALELAAFRACLKYMYDQGVGRQEDNVHHETSDNGLGTKNKYLGIPTREFPGKSRTLRTAYADLNHFADTLD